MSYDEHLAARIRAQLARRRDVAEKKMFGGLCFLVKNAMCCGITPEDFMVRVGKKGFADAIAQPYARAMDFTGTPSTSAVYVDAKGLKTAKQLGRWIDRGLAVALEAKPKSAKKTKARPEKTVRKKTR